MRRKSALGLVVLFTISVALMFCAVVSAATTTLNPGSYHDETYEMQEGDLLTWNWHVVGVGNIDFWVEDSEGTRYFFLDNATESDAWFTIPEDGDWTYGMLNDATNGPAVVVEYDIEIVPATIAGDLITALMWLFIVMGIVIFAGIIVIVWVGLRKRKLGQHGRP